ncbi:MAG: ATP-dependent DNA helicase RecG [Acidimicrobiaceae bacterium]|nr:ATP-dependent DNA helicase RecG [Acidimicrobiaceae bacterium]MDE0516127.1 ATP-dependent DNA helicase RecG [Acidimicrobiaceae bacterium]MXZ94515.1 ATP-dependent DNA helicase RecG [Acidimicrobiaceae bacterium]MYF42616.1 ATP-dependent DNA helicase RecG [Acidimicrobiaceae bacterium]
MPEGDPPLSLRDLDAIEVGRLRDVGRKRATALTAMEINSVLDLLQHYPRRYIDRTNQARIAELAEGEDAFVEGSVHRSSSRRTKQRRTLVEVIISDDTGRLKLTFFNQPWQEQSLRPGRQVIVYGRPTRYRGSLQMTNPVVDLVGDRTGRFVPVYPQSEKVNVSTWEIAKFVDQALNRCQPRGIADPVPAGVLQRFDFVGRNTALNGIHRPTTMRESSEARRRLMFDELLRVQVELVRRKRWLERHTAGLSHATDGELVDRFLARLPFPLTAAQQRVIDEIAGDLAMPHPMHRLMQGDVGAGKTVVALCALLTAVQGGFQGALMAPTEVLAEQHFATMVSLLGDLSVPDETRLGGERPLRVELLSGSRGAADRRRAAHGLAAGDVDIVVGTHALISEGLEYRALGVVVIDEQHRFGVEQRAVLRDRGPGSVLPDLLVMTATPIPRTAAMTVYGDLDVSVLDELPAGRLPVATSWARGPLEEAQVWGEARTAVAEGRQAYVVCPVIEESDVLDVRSVIETHERLTSGGGELAGLRVGLLHGRVTPAEKEATMELFRSGRLDVLVATTVIEVGVDVPNATVMVVVDAGRFGIAQLHQLRGRVGRSHLVSSCYLLGEAVTAEAEARLEAVVASNDGFELAEVDLELRGEGTIMGERQRGRNDLRLASLRRDKEWVAIARDVAIEMLDADPDLLDHRELADEIELLLGDADAEYLLKS